MTKKKAEQSETKTEQSTKKRPLALGEHRTHRLRKDQLMKWRMLEAEASKAEAQYHLAEFKLAALISSRPDIVAAQANRKAAQETFKSAREVYLQYMGEIGKSLNVDMKRVAIDEGTGLVRELDGEMGNQTS